MGVLVLFFGVGAAGIAAQVAWLRVLGPIYGSTAEATAMVLAVYLAALALGSLVFGSVVARGARPMLRFGALLALAGGVLLLGPELRGWSLGEGVRPRGLAVLFPLFASAFCLGGTWPLLAELVPGRAAGWGVGSLSLANNLGGAVGAVVGGLVLVPWLGLSATLRVLGGVLIALAIAAVAVVPDLARRPAGESDSRWDDPAPESPSRLPAIGWLAVYAAAAVAFLGLEVVWTRLLSMIFQNSAYTFASVVAVFLLGLAAGGAIAARWADRWERPGRAAGMVLVAVAGAGLIPAVAFGPLLRLHDAWLAGGGGPSLGSSVSATAIVTLIGLLPATVGMGCLFPLLARLLGARERRVGATVGLVFGVGTLASVAGGPLAGFWLLPALGASRSLLVLAVVLYIPGMLLLLRELRPGERSPLRTGFGLAAAAALLGVATPLVPGPVEAALAPGETLLAALEGREALAAVVIDTDGHRRLKVNRTYSMGGDLGVRVEERQGIIPLLCHPHPQDVLVIGLGTGVTCGAATIDPEVTVDCVEILPEVIELAEHFREDNRDVLHHPRVTVHLADGRTFLAGSKSRWDVIISDLFFPWRRGVGPLYSVEHLEAAKARLEPHGTYWQWLALHQLTPEELDRLHATFRAVFPRVEIWMADLSGEVPVAALVGRSEKTLQWPGRYLVPASYRRLGVERLGRLGLMSERDVRLLHVESQVEPWRLARPGEPITDDLPTLELTSARNFHRRSIDVLRPHLVRFREIYDDRGGPRNPVPQAAAAILAGEIARIDGDPVEEMRQQLRALRLAPGLSRPREAILNRAWRYLYLGNRESAAAVLRSFLEVAPDDAEGKAMLEQAEGGG